MSMHEMYLTIIRHKHIRRIVVILLNDVQEGQPNYMVFYKRTSPIEAVPS